MMAAKKFKYFIDVNLGMKKWIAAVRRFVSMIFFPFIFNAHMLEEPKRHKKRKAMTKDYFELEQDDMTSIPGCIPSV